MNNFLLGVITGVVSSILVAIGKSIYINSLFYMQSKYSGKWKDEIYDSEGNIVKQDEYNLKHHKRNNTITGTIIRVAPVEQIHRHWKCSGVLSGEHLILSFWSEDVIKSDGCIYTVLKDDFIYEGFYLKEEDNNKLSSIKIRLIKERGR
jgi:hypothetical protein